MIIYEATVPKFIEIAKNPIDLAIEIKANLLNKFGILVAENEVRSWMMSLPRVAALLSKEEKDMRRVLVEFNIPTSKQRVDFIILGEKKDGTPSAWLLELKQWSDITEVNWNEFRVGKYTDTHPSDQAEKYKFRLDHEMGLIDKLDLKTAAYLHNLETHKSPLFNEEYKKMLEAAALYSSLDEKELANNIDEHTIVRDGGKAFELLKEANWKPSKVFKEIVNEEFKNTHLVGSQQTIYEKIEKFVKTKNKEQKITFIISGDPGSGKTIVAFKLMMLLVKELEMRIQLMIPGQEVRDAFRYELRKKMLSQYISGSTMWKGYEAAIIDEAHKAVGRDTGLTNYKRFYETLNFAIIFIDDDQVINRKGIGKDQVKKIAEAAGHTVHQYNIEENFRNAGERALLDWIDHIFYGRKTINREYEYSQIKYLNDSFVYKVRGYKTDADFVNAYYSYKKKSDSVRMTSLWHEQFYNGPANSEGDIPKTVPIGNYKFAWNPNQEWFDKISPEDKKTYSKELKTFVLNRRNFLIGKPKPEYIAYFNHIQGYEFKDIFVYIPKVFTYENGEIIFHRDRLAKEVKTSQTWSPSSQAHGLEGMDPQVLNKRYFLNRIKVMLTRGTESTHVYAEDEALNKLIFDSID